MEEKTTTVVWEELENFSNFLENVSKKEKEKKTEHFERVEKLVEKISRMQDKITERQLHSAKQMLERASSCFVFSKRQKTQIKSFLSSFLKNLEMNSKTTKSITNREYLKKADETLEEYMRNYLPSKLDEKRVEETRKKMEEILKREFPSLKVEVTGSFSTFTALEGSDIDMTVSVGEIDNILEVATGDNLLDNQIKIFEEILLKSGVRKVELVLEARVPLIKIIDKDKFVFNLFSSCFFYQKKVSRSTFRWEIWLQ